MLKIYQGDIKLVKKEIEKLFRNSKVSKIKFSKNILSENFHGLFYKPTLFYFLYSKEIFKDKETIEGLIKKWEDTDSIIVCILEEQLDKKTIQYKYLKQHIEEVNSTVNNKSDEKSEILRDLVNTYNIEDNKFTSLLFSLAYTKYKQSANFVLNLILTGRLNNTALAKKLFITLATMR